MPPKDRAAHEEQPARVAVISDTHGLVRSEVLYEIQGASLVIHGGDIGGAEVLPRLSGLAPTVAVRGNNDREEWCLQIPLSQRIEVAGVRIYVIHDLEDLDLDPVAAGIGVVISGHSHRPSIRRQAGVLYLNPGSAGPRRFKLPVSMARLYVSPNSLEASLVDLDCRPGLR